MVADADAADNSVAALTSAALKVQEKDKGGGDVEGGKDKQQSQYQSSGQTSAEAGVNSHNSTNNIGNSSTTSLLASAAVLMVTPSDTVTQKYSSRDQDQEQELRGSKRGRMDIANGAHVGQAQKDKTGNIAAPFGSSSSSSSDVSVMSDRMKALSTSTAIAVTDRTSVAVTATVAVTDNNLGENPQYVRRGAKRASLGSERPVATVGGDAVAAVSGLDDAGEDGDDDEVWKKKEASKEVKSDAPAVVASSEASENVAIYKGTSKIVAADKQKSGGSLYLCLGRENGSENADETETAGAEESDEADGTCHFKTGSRAARRNRAIKRASMSSSLTQKSDPCVIL